MRALQGLDENSSEGRAILVLLAPLNYSMGVAWHTASPGKESPQGWLSLGKDILYSLNKRTGLTSKCDHRQIFNAYIQNCELTPLFPAD